MNGPPDASPRLSFKGWLLSVWLTKNKNFVKGVLAGWASVVGTLSGLGRAEAEILLAATGLAVLSIGARLVLDVLDFYVSDVDLP